MDIPTLPEPGEFGASQMTADTLATMLCIELIVGSGMLPMPISEGGDSLSVFVIEVTTLDDEKKMLLIPGHLAVNLMMGAMRYVMAEMDSERTEDETEVD